MFGEGEARQKCDYSFDEARLSELLGEATECLCDLVAILEENDFLNKDEFFALIEQLISEDMRISFILFELKKLPRRRFFDLMDVFKTGEESCREWLKGANIDFDKAED